MSQEKRESKGLTRRAFVKGAAMVAGAGVLVSCQASTGSSTEQPVETSQPTTATAATEAPVTAPTTASAAQQFSFEIPPDPIPDSDISSTVETEIVIVGSGTSGLVTANTAVENGAKVILISASKGNMSRGGSNHAMNSKFMQESGFPIADTDRFLRTELAAAGYNCDQTKWWKYAKYSGEAFDWLIDKMEAAGYQTVLEIGNTEPNDGPMAQPVGSHSWISADMPMAGAGQQFVVDTLAQTAADAGVQIIYQTVAKQLVREDNNTGRVTAVIAQDAEGKYIKYVGSKAIVLATGDFSADTEMMTKYCPEVLPLLSSDGDQGYDTGLKWGGIYKGDGQKMGLWIGAAWQKSFPACPMVSAKQSVPPQNQPYGFHRGLMMNINGERYGNEDINQSFAGWSQFHQPQMKVYAIWDVDYAEAAKPWYSFGQKWGDDPKPPETIVEKWEKAVESGSMVKADTVEEIIQKLNLPADTTSATVDRYNELCDKGVDEDFFKRAELLIPIKTAPFYGCEVPSVDFLTVLGGLRTNVNMQVCDADDQPIPGLYNVGSMVGDFFANIYNFRVTGQCLGATCVTFGYLTGKYIATQA